MTQYKRAIIWHYKQHSTILDQIIDTFLKEIMKGYKRIIAQKHVSEIRAVNEGKRNYLSQDMWNYVVIYMEEIFEWNYQVC